MGVRSNFTYGIYVKSIYKICYEFQDGIDDIKCS